MSDAHNGGNDAAPVYAWAPAEPKPKKNRTALWISLPVGATLVALVAASLVLIAPGASVAGVQIGGLTPGAAADAISTRLADTEVEITTPGGTLTVTGADLGATVDAAAVADAAFAANPMWNPSTWFPSSVEAPVTIDDARAGRALRAASPGLFVDPADAAVSFDAASASYVVTDAVPGEGVDLAAVRDTLQGAFDAGTGVATMDAAIVPVDAAVTTDEAAATAGSLNAVLDQAGFYVGEERTVAVDRAVAASWLTVADDDGTLRVTADAAAIQSVVDTLPAAVDRAQVDATVITDTAGNVLEEESVGATGRTLGSTDGIADQFAAMLAEGQARFPLTVTETPFTTKTLARSIEVNLTTQTVYLYENGETVKTWLASTGKAETPTGTGRFKIGWKTPLQDLGCFPGAEYCTEDVPWVQYFNGDEAFHGTYWHNNFGQVMSHGCVNLPIPEAKFLYDWAPRGVDVWVHY